MQTMENPMRAIRIDKVVINIGVGKSGEPLEKAKKVLQELTGHKPSAREAKKSVRDFNIHKKEPIGVMVTLRSDDAINTLKRLLAAKNNQIKSSSFDEYGNVSFGIKEHIDIAGIKYNPEIGIFGMDVSVRLARAGYRISERRYRRSKIGKNHMINKEEAIAFFKDMLKTVVI